MNRQIIIFGEDWGTHPSSTQHLAHELMKRYDIIWVNSIGLRRPTLTLRDIKRMAMKLKQIICPGYNDQNRRLRSPSKVIAPKVFPIPGNKVMRRINSYFLNKTIQPYIRDKTTRTMILTSLPSAVDVIEKIDGTVIVYYCGDDFSSLEGVEHEPIMEMETELVDKADLILAASPVLLEKFPKTKSVLLQHGVDYSLFAEKAPIAPDFPNHPGPIAGFYGSLAGWLNQSLIIDSARQLPEWRFIFIGNPQVDVSALAAEPNIDLIGSRAHHELPGYIQHWDVSILPFCNNSQIKACNPLKLREYLAAGTPIVSTEFPALDGYRDLINIAKDTSSFVSALKRSHKEPENYSTRRRNRVSEESWSSRADKLHSLFENL